MKTKRKIKENRRKVLKNMRPNREGYGSYYCFPELLFGVPQIDS